MLTKSISQFRGGGILDGHNYKSACSGGAEVDKSFRADFWRSLQPQEDVRTDRRTPQLVGACSAHGNSRNGCRRHAQHEEELERLRQAQRGRELAICAALIRSIRSCGLLSGQAL